MKGVKIFLSDGENPLKKYWFWFKKRKFWQTVVIVLIVVGLMGLGTAIGVYKALLQNLPPVSDIEEFEPGIITYIYADDEEVIAEFAEQKRVEIAYEDIPEILKQAILATEDPRFFKHSGIDFLGIFRAALENIKNLGKVRPHGGSTITQQLVRDVLKMSRAPNMRRKLKEIILSLKIEKRYNKEQIFTLYCNQFYLGHGSYGVEAVSQKYFGKSVAEVNLVEAALIAGIFRGPSIYSPYNNPKLMLKRRNHVLNRMYEEGYISKDVSESAQEEPVSVLPRNAFISDFAAYFIEEVRKYLIENYGSDSLYRDGLKVYTTLNRDYQHYSEKALRTQLHVLDKKQGWRKDKPNLVDMEVEEWEQILKPLKDKNNPDRVLLDSWLKLSVENGDIVEAIVLEVERRKAGVKVRDYTGILANKKIAWTKSNNLKTLIKKGDIIHVRIDKIDEEKKTFQATLDQEPELEGAFLAIEPQTGQIKAMIGGYSFKKLKFNQATQALRQSGSVIKPLLYTAALENGYSPTSIFIDEPTEFPDKWSGTIYSPPNYDEKYKGAVTLRQGLEESRNIVSVRVLDAISPQVGVDYVKKFGITSPVYPYLSLALGAFEIRMIELVSAFSTFPNKGVRITPYLITRVEDKDGNILEESEIESYEVISPQLAYIMTTFLRGVVQRGTAWPVAVLEKNLCGKTGTTDNFSDAWFMGFSPRLCAGVWIGHEKERRKIGDRQSGMVAALPVWQSFFSQIIEEEKKTAEEAGEEYKPEEFEIPPHLEFVEIDRRTGLLFNPFICLSQYMIREVFLPTMTKPSRHCTYEDHMMTYDYYRSLVKK